VIILLGTGGANGGGYMASKYVLLAIYGVILILHGLINCLPIDWLSWFGHLGVFWNTAGIYLHSVLSKKKESDHSNACCFDCMDTLYMLCM
jgi:hypothetical protein